MTDPGPLNENVPEEADGLVRRRRIPGTRAIVIAAAVLSVLDLWLLRSTGASWLRSCLGALLMGAFVVFAMRAIVRLRLRYRPHYEAPEARDPSAPPPAGGWATKTRGQSFVSGMSRALSGLRRPRPPRDRRDRRP